MKDIRTIRKAVATMANQLHKIGYSLSQAYGGLPFPQAFPCQGNYRKRKD